MSKALVLGLVCIVVGMINVLLNILVKRAAEQSGSIVERIFTTNFAIAFAVGLLSLLSLFTVYAMNVQLGKAIILMGASSIVGGSIISVLFFGTQLSVLEIVILVSIGAFYTVRMIQ